VADKSEKYKREYEKWISKKSKQLITKMAAAKPPQILSEDEAREIVAKTMGDEWKKSAEYKKLQRDSETGQYATQTVTTTNRFTEMLTKKRAARIMEEKPGTTEEAAFAEAEKDVLKRESDDKKNVSESTDPIAAKILTNISSILMDISEDVVALRESGSNALDKAEADREKGKGEDEKEKDLDTGKSRWEIFLDGLILMLAPFFLGLASKFVDLTKPLGLLTGAVLAAAMAFGTWKAVTVAGKSIKGAIFGPKQMPTGIPAPGVPTPTPGVPAPTGGVGAKNTNAGFGKSLAGFGKGAGSAIKSVLIGITDGVAYMGDNLARIAKGALALGLIGAAFAPFALSLRLLENVKTSTVLAATLAIGTVSASVIALGKAGTNLYRGVGALLALGGAMAIFGVALESINKINPGELMEVGLAIVGFALIAALLGPAIKFIALGSLAMVVLAGGLMALGKALEVVAPSLESASESFKKFAEIDGNNLLKVAAGIAGVGLAMLGFSAAMLAASAMGVGSAVLDFFTDSPLEKVLEFAEDAKDVDVAGAAEAVSKLTKAIKQLDSISGANLFNIGAGLTAVSAGLVAFSASNVTAGLGNLVTKFLSFLSGGKTPVEQIIELSEKHRQIFEAGKGVESMGKGIDSFSGVDTEKLSRSIEIITSLSDSELEKLAKFQVVQSQPAATQELGQAREGVNNAQGEKSAQSAPAVVNNVNQTAVNKSDTTYKSTRSGPAVKGDALLMGA
jgi:hypothetical protein